MHFAGIVNMVKARKVSLRVTQDPLAQVSGVAVRTLKQFESTKGNPTVQTLQKLGDALSLEITFAIKE